MIRRCFRLLFLHVRSRGWAASVLPPLAAGIGGTLVRERAEDQVVTLLAVVIVPAVSAALLCIAFVSPARAIERSLPTPIGLLEMIHYLAGAALASTVLAMLANGWHASSLMAIVRNGCGYSGLAMLGAGVLGAELGWILPVVYSTVIAAVVFQQGGDLSGVPQRLWLWPALPDAEPGARFIGPALLVAGVALVAARERWR